METHRERTGAIAKFVELTYGSTMVDLLFSSVVGDDDEDSDRLWFQFGFTISSGEHFIAVPLDEAIEHGLCEMRPVRKMAVDWPKLRRDNFKVLK